MIRTPLALLLACAWLCCAGAQDCGTAAPAAASDPAAAVAFVRDRFAAGDYTCAVQTMRAQSAAVASRPGREGFDARFALRETALAMLHTAAPAPMRADLVRAAVISASGHSFANEDAERLADLAMLATAGEIFYERLEIEERMTLFALAIDLNRMLREQDGRSFLQGGLSRLVPYPHKVSEWPGALALLGESTRGEPAYAQIRQQWIYDLYVVRVARDGDDAAAIEQRGAQIVAALDAFPEPGRCSPCLREWHWRPVWRVAVAYDRAGLTDQALELMNRAAAIVATIEDPTKRLQEYAILFDEAIPAVVGNRPRLADLVRQVQPLANSSDTPIARMLSDLLPTYLERLRKGL